MIIEEKGFQKTRIQLSYILEENSQENKGNLCEPSSCAHKAAKHNSFIQLQHRPTNKKSEKYSEKQPTVFMWEYGIILP